MQQGSIASLTAKSFNHSVAGRNPNLLTAEDAKDAEVTRVVDVTAVRLKIE